MPLDLRPVCRSEKQNRTGGGARATQTIGRMALLTESADTAKLRGRSERRIAIRARHSADTDPGDERDRRAARVDRRPV
jgi:hypothetical protein